MSEKEFWKIIESLFEQKIELKEEKVGKKWTETQTTGKMIKVF